MEKRKLGTLGEETAALLLQEEGYEILERNYYTRYGEIDLICRKKGITYFTEVKTRRTMDFGRPSESVNWKKIIHMKRAAARYIEDCRTVQQYDFMVIEIYINVIKNFI